MVVSCVAFGCTNEQDARIPIPYHSFPFKRPEVLKLWVEAMRRENWWPSKSSRICGEHFLPSDYQDRPGYKIKLLNPSAVPSVFCFSNYPEMSATPPQQSIEDVVTQDVTSDVKEESMVIESFHPSGAELGDLPSTSTESPDIFIQQETQTTCNTDDLSQMKIHQETQTGTYETNALSHMKIDRATQANTYETNKVPRMKREIKSLKQKLRRKNLKISSMKSCIKEISKSGYSDQNLDLQTIDNHYIYVSKSPITGTSESNFSD